MVAGIPSKDQEDGETMNTTYIPNGYVVRGPCGNTIFVDFNESGKADNQDVEIAISGWPASIMENERIKADIMVLVHAVKGTEGMLVRSLQANKLAMDGNPISVASVARSGKLSKMAEKIFVDYMESLKKTEGLITEVETTLGKVQEGIKGAEVASAIEDHHALRDRE